MFRDPHFGDTGEYIALSLAFDLMTEDEPVQPGSPMSVAETIDHLNHNIDPLLGTIHIKEHHQRNKEPDYESLQSRFAYVPVDMIKKTFAATTQWAHNIYCLPRHKHLKSRFPGLNVPWHNEPVATTPSSPMYLPLMMDLPVLNCTLAPSLLCLTSLV